jgi:hypothetical protein
MAPPSKITFVAAQPTTQFPAVLTHRGDSHNFPAVQGVLQQVQANLAAYAGLEGNGRGERQLAILCHTRGVPGTGCASQNSNRRKEFTHTVVYLVSLPNGSWILDRCTNCRYACDGRPCGAVPLNQAGNPQGPPVTQAPPPAPAVAAPPHIPAAAGPSNPRRQQPHQRIASDSSQGSVFQGPRDMGPSRERIETRAGGQPSHGPLPYSRRSQPRTPPQHRRNIRDVSMSDSDAQALVNRQLLGSPTVSPTPPPRLLIASMAAALPDQRFPAGPPRGFERGSPQANAIPGHLRPGHEGWEVRSDIVPGNGGDVRDLTHGNLRRYQGRQSSSGEGRMFNVPTEDLYEEPSQEGDDIARNAHLRDINSRKGALLKAQRIGIQAALDELEKEYANSIEEWRKRQGGRRQGPEDKDDDDGNPGGFGGFTGPRGHQGLAANTAR